MALSKQQLDNLHLRNQAQFDRKYFGDDGKVYIGTKQGRLRLLDFADEVIVSRTDTINSRNVQEAIEEVSTSITETAQDAVGTILTNSSNIDLVYDDSTPSITADLTDTAVTPGTYGNATNVSQITVDQKGRITSATQLAITFPTDTITAVSDTSTIDLTITGTTLSGIVIDDSITNGKLRNSGALSVIGRSVNSTGDPADISATAATDSVLRESGSTIGFGTIATGGIANDAVTYAKIQNVSATDKLLGRSTAGAGDVEEIDCTAAGRALLDDASASAQRTTLGLVIGTDVAAISDVYFTISLTPQALNPADATTYYFPCFNGAAVPTVTATNWDSAMPYNVQIIGAVIQIVNNTTAGTTEDSTLQIRNTTTATSSVIGTFKTNASTTAHTTATMSGLSIAVSAGDMICMQWDAPTFVTNPVAASLRGVIFCKRT